MPLIFEGGCVYYLYTYGPLAQLAERLVDVEKVTGSSPVQSIEVFIVIKSPVKLNSPLHLYPQ